MTPESIFVHDGERFVATELALGPWAPGALHGGAPAALLVHEILAASPNPDLRLARITYEFVRPAPLGALSATVSVIRPGRRVALLEASLFDAAGTEVTRARALLVRPGELGEPDAGPPPFPGPDQGAPNDWSATGPRFATHAMEIRFVQGAFRQPGPASAWFRLRHPLIGGQPVHPLERLAAAGDFGNGIASVLSWDDHVFINPDLTLYIEREPVGDWVGLESVMRATPGSVAVAESVLWDQRGRVGSATQALLVGPR